MPRISALEFERLPLRVHTFLAGVPLHDVWAVDLPRIRPGITLDEFLRTGGARPYRLSLVVRALLSIRLFIGRLLGWDRVPTGTAWETFAKRLTTVPALSALVEMANTYRFYFGVYVCNVSRFTPIYMALIDPFRKLIVDPSPLRSVRASWNRAFGAG